MLPTHAFIHRGLTLPTARKVSTALSGFSQHGSRVLPSILNARPRVRTFFRLWQSSTTGTAKPKTTTKPKARANSKRPQTTTKKATQLSGEDAPVKKQKAAVAASKRGRKAKPNHHDYASWLAHVDREGIDLNDASQRLHRGTDYEYTVLDRLQGYNFELQRIGRAGDLGIDLTGHWSLPTAPKELKVVVQCKAGGASPSHMRELQSSLSNSALHRGPNSLALMVSTKKATKGVSYHMQLCSKPMAFMWMSRDGLLLQFTFNDAAEKAFLSGLSTRRVFVPVPDGRIRKLFRGERFQDAVVLCWEDKPWPGLPLDDFQWPSENEE